MPLGISFFPKKYTFRASNSEHFSQIGEFPQRLRDVAGKTVLNIFETTIHIDSRFNFQLFQTPTSFLIILGNCFIKSSGKKHPMAPEIFGPRCFATLGKSDARALIFFGECTLEHERLEPEVLMGGGGGEPKVLGILGLVYLVLIGALLG